MSFIGEPLPGLSAKQRIAAQFERAEATSVEPFSPTVSDDLEKYLAEDRWAPTAHWLQGVRSRIRERRAKFVGHFIDTTEFTEKSGRKGLILAGAVAVGVLVAVVAPNAEELHEQRQPVAPAVAPASTPSANDDCGNRVRAMIEVFPEYARETPLLLSRCRDGQSLVINTIEQQS